MKKMKKTDNKLTMIKIRFGQENFKKLTKKEISQLSDSDKDLFYFIEKFVNLVSV